MNKNQTQKKDNNSVSRFSYEGGVTRFSKDAKIIKRKDGTISVQNTNKGTAKKG